MAALTVELVSLREAISMARSPSSSTIGMEPCRTSFRGGFAALKERQLVFLLVRQLADAQFRRGDRAASERLWQEVADLGIDPDRIIALLYGADDLNDPEALERIDFAFRMEAGWASSRRRRSGYRPVRSALPAGRSGGWFGGVGIGGFSGPRSGGGHRSAPPANPPARRPAG